MLGLTSRQESITYKLVAINSGKEVDELPGEFATKVEAINAIPSLVSKLSIGGKSCTHFSVRMIRRVAPVVTESMRIVATQFQKREIAEPVGAQISWG